jgi:hypothetical protein
VRPTTLLLALVLVASILSGCTKGAGPAATSAPSAPPPAPKADAGTISGVILTEEEAPIKGAQVALLGTQNETRTDDAGKFVFNGLPPGSYKVAVSSLGFETLGRSVDVLAGEVSEVKYTLKTIEIKPDPYKVVLPFKGLIQCSVNPEYSVNPCAGVTGEEKNFFSFHIDAANLKETVVELIWTPSTPGTAADLELDFCDDVPGRTPGVLCFDNNFYDYNTAGSPNVIHEPKVPADKFDKFLVGAGGGLQSSVAFQQSFDLYVSMCYYEECGETYSAVAPAG